MLNEAQIYIICIEEQSQMKVIPNLNLKQAKLWISLFSKRLKLKREWENGYFNGNGSA